MALYIATALGVGYRPSAVPRDHPGARARVPSRVKFGVEPAPLVTKAGSVKRNVKTKASCRVGAPIKPPAPRL